jgi:phosphate transport system ATP-binding protein
MVKKTQQLKVNQINQEGDLINQEANQINQKNTAKNTTTKLEIRNFNFYYGSYQALKNINLEIPEKRITAMIGPSGCGKTTLLRCFNRMHDLYPGNRYEGEVILCSKNMNSSENINIVGGQVDPTMVRMKVGMVFQKPNPFPKSIYENVAYGLRVKGIKKKEVIKEKVEEALRDAALWDEVKNRLHENAYTLSGGQQQRLCIARAIAVEPEILLFDEPTSALDPKSTSKIEDLMIEFKDKLTVLVVTHNMQQASRVADFTAFMYLGELIEFDETGNIFINPRNKLTEDYVSGRFG